MENRINISGWQIEDLEHWLKAIIVEKMVFSAPVEKYHGCDVERFIEEKMSKINMAQAILDKYIELKTK